MADVDGGGDRAVRAFGLLDGKKTAPARLQIVGRENDNSLIEIEIHEGRKRQVKLMMDAVGHPVIRLERIRFAFMGLEGLKRGKYRILSADEVQRLIMEASGRSSEP